MIKNADYKGPWVHPLIPNPDYKDDPTIYAYDSFAAVGIEIWQVKAGTIFDNFLVTDDEAEAKKHGESVIQKMKLEKTSVEKAKEEEKKQREAEAAKKETEEEDEKESSEDDDDKDEKKTKDEL